MRNLICQSEGCNLPVKEPHFRTGKRADKLYYYKYCQPCLNLKKSYGITAPERDKLLANQEGLCANKGCLKKIYFKGKGFEGDSDNAHTDHNHRTGKIRGILCRNCNMALGMLEDKPQKLTGLFDYLKKEIE